LRYIESWLFMFEKATVASDHFGRRFNSCAFL